MGFWKNPLPPSTPKNISLRKLLRFSVTEQVLGSEGEMRKFLGVFGENFISFWRFNSIRGN